MINSVDNIIYFIRQNKKPYLKLMQKSGYEWAYIGIYQCELSGESAPEEERIEKAVIWLTEYLEHFPSNANFRIEMKSSKNGNKGDILNFEFSKQPETASEPEKQFAGLGAVTEPDRIKQLGYVHQSEMEAALLRKEKEFEKELDKRERDDMRKEFDYKLETAISAANTWSPDKITQLAGIVSSFIKKGTPAAALSGADEPEEKNDLKAAAVQSFAEVLYKEMDLASIERLKQTVLKSVHEKPNGNE